MDDELEKFPRFLAYWSNEGLESIVDLHHIVKLKTWDVLKNPDLKHTSSGKIGAIINSMIMRSRFNDQREYELYAFNADDGVTQEDIEEAFTASPQIMADTIRKLGSCLHSTKRSKPASVIN